MIILVYWLWIVATRPFARRLTLSVFNQLGINFIDWNADKQAFEKFITSKLYPHL